MNDKVAKWVNNTQIPAAEQLEILDRARAMIAEAIDLLESIAVVGNEFNFGTIHLLKDALDEKGTFNFYPSLRNWRIGLVAQRDNELEKSPPQPQFLKGTKVRVKQGWRQHLRDTKPIVIENYEANDGEVLTVQTYSPTRRDYSLTSDGMEVLFVHADWLEPARPPVGAIVQHGHGVYWDYTGEVIEHHPHNLLSFKVFWHKWGGSPEAEADNHTLTAYEWSMNNCRVVERPIPGQWWPEGRR